MLRRASRLSRELHDAGVRRGDVVLSAIGNRPSFIVAALAAWKCDAVLLPADEDLPASAIDSLKEAFRPAAVVSVRAGGSPVVGALPPSPRTRLPGAAMVRLTSGTTGKPKGVIVTAAQLVADARALIERTSLGPDEINVGAVPLGHTYGFDLIVVPLAIQGTPAILLRRPLPSLILAALRTRRPTFLAAVPYLFDLLSRQPVRSPRPGGLRFCLSAGAPLPARVAEAFRERFGVGVRNLYGTSETGAVALDDSPVVPAGCAGRPVRGARVTIDRAGLSHLPRREGRIVVKGPAVAHGYFPDPSSDLRRGRFRTSDTGFLDEQGRLHLTGRVSSFVNVSGKKVNPAEVERAIRAVPGVSDVVALGVRDALRGERLEAWVVVDGVGLGDGDGIGIIREALAAALPRFKHPTSLHIVGEIPRTSRGKLDRVRLLAGS